MTVENDLTPEERAEFEAQGVAFDQPPVEEGSAPLEPEQPATEGEAPVDGAAPAEEPAPVEGAEPAAAPPPGFVPHAALHAERQAKADLQRQNLLMKARMNAVLAERTPDAEPLPDMDADPVGYMQALEQRVEEVRSSRAAEQETARIDAALQDDEASFQSFTPDYEQAMGHYVQSRATELLMFHSPDQASQILTNEVRAIARQSWAKGVPAAQSLYDLARARGYAPGAAPAPTPAPRPTAAAPQAAPVARVAPAAAVASVKAGQATGRSMSTAKGATGKTAPTAEEMLTWTDEQFEDWLKPGSKGANARFAEIG